VEWETHPHRFIDAFGSKVTKIIDPLIISGTDAVLGHTVTLVEAGAGETTIDYGTVGGGGVLITTAGNEDDGLALQDNNLAFKALAPCKMIYFGTRLKLSEATQSDLFVGLTGVDTTPLGGVQDGIYFRKADASASLAFVTEKDTTETSTAVHTVVADTYMVLEFLVDVVNGKVYAYVDGVLMATHTTNIVDNEFVGFNFQVLNGDANVRTCRIDWRRIIAIGGRDGES
jgi:hypothetical protein